MENIWKTIFGNIRKKLNIVSKLLFIVTCLIASTIFTYYYYLFTNEYHLGTFEKIANHEANKVFQTRLLITETANFLSPTIPLIDKLFSWLIPYPVNYEVLLQLITILFLFLLLIFLPYFTEILGTKTNPWLSLLILIPLSWNYIALNGLIDGAGLYYTYDIPSLTFFCVGTILFVKKKWIFFYFVFVLALLNRESACFISIAGFLLTVDFRAASCERWINKNKFLLIHIFTQVVLWITSRIMLSWIFRYNQGEFFETPHSMIEFMVCIIRGETHWAMQNPRWFLTIFAGIWIIPVILIKSLNKLEKRLSICAFTYIISLIFRSNMMEVRVYNELNIIIFLIAISVLSRRVQIINKKLRLCL